MNIFTFSLYCGIDKVHCERKEFEIFVEIFVLGSAELKNFVLQNVSMYVDSSGEKTSTKLGTYIYIKKTALVQLPLRG